MKVFTVTDSTGNSHTVNADGMAITGGRVDLFVWKQHSNIIETPNKEAIVVQVFFTPASIKSDSKDGVGTAMNSVAN